jgi:FimV-like protein
MYIKKVILLLALAIANFSYAQETYGPLTTGETLWVIAAKVSPSNEVTRHQVMIALLHANPQAFSIPCNINSLRINQTLLIPSLDEIKKYTHAEAVAMYNRQNTEWRTRRSGVEIECETDPSPTMASLATPTPEVAEVAEVVIVDDTTNSEEITLPTIETPSTAPNLAEIPENNDDNAANATEEIPATQLNTEEPINYLPIIIILGVVAFVFTLAFLLRDSIKSRPIPEDLT